MLDTRLEGRMKQVTATDSTLNDTTRTLMGAPQLAWFKDKLSNSTAQWKVIGNQVMISPLINGGTPLNLDQWDGYPAERKKVYNHISKNNIKDIVFLTGDIHTSWGNDLPPKDSTYNKTTGAGSIAVEFVCTSITSPGLPGIGNTLIGLVQSQNPYMKYVDLEKHGYLLLDINKQRTQGDWVYMSTLTDKNYTTSIGGSWYTDHNQTFLKQASSAAAPRPNAAPFAPQFQGNPNGIAEASKETMVVVSCFPNPTAGELKIQYYLFAPQKVTVGIYDMAGKLVMSQPETQSSAGLFETEMNIQNLAAGNYLITINAGGKNYSQKMVKGK
jgi:alkaline phosphatase D